MLGEAFGVLRYFVEHAGQLVTKDKKKKKNELRPLFLFTGGTMAPCRHPVED
ncbi:MAG: hypothetical protein AB7G75_01260 [Candidatus Binatia bacterium]